MKMKLLAYYYKEYALLRLIAFNEETYEHDFSINIEELYEDVICGKVELVSEQDRELLAFFYRNYDRENCCFPDSIRIGYNDYLKLKKVFSELFEI